MSTAKRTKIETIIDVLLAVSTDNGYIIACGETIIGATFDN